MALSVARRKGDPTSALEESEDTSRVRQEKVLPQYQNGRETTTRIREDPAPDHRERSQG